GQQVLQEMAKSGAPRFQLVTIIQTMPRREEKLTATAIGFLFSLEEVAHNAILEAAKAPIESPQ
ncbi:MAG: hypothetical protein R8J84_05125, partial [Mariprofundales bacterium]